jgi:glycosyltransferase involved in cell wall biosynthesis
MRVLTFLHSFEPGGVERVALRLNRTWLADGVDAVVVMGRADGAMADQAAGIDYGTLSSGRIPTAFWETLWMILTLPRYIRRSRPAVLFCAGNSYSIVAVAMKLVLGKRCPPVVAKISNDLARADMLPPMRWAYRKWCRLQGRFIDHFVGMAAPMRAEIRAAMGVDNDRVSIIHDPAISLNDIQPFVRAAPSRGRHFIAAGRLSSQKNFALLIDAFSAMATEFDQLTIYGEGPDRQALEQQIKRLGLTPQIALPGFINALIPKLQASDVFVLSSNYEGVPAVIIEALAAGIPIVATDCSVSMGALLDRGTLGILVQTGDGKALAEAMRNAANGPDKVADRQGQAAQFTVERAASAYVELFRRIGGIR